MRKKISISLIAILVIFSWAGETTAQKNRLSQEFLNDIEVMETVLDKLIKPNSHNVFWGNSNSKGFYLLDYGVIFNVHYSLLNDEMVEVKFDKLLRTGRANTYIVKEEEEEKQKNEANLKKEIDQLKKSLSRFLGSYASSIRNLKTGENITVIVDFNGFIGGFRRSFEDTPRQLIATVKIADLKNYRQGKISDSIFNKKIKFSKIDSFDEDISILGNVIKTSLEHADGSGGFGLSGDIKGVHLKGYGVLFITDVNWGIGGMRQFFLGDNNKGSFSFSITSSDQDKSIKGMEKDLKKLEHKLIRSVSNYGHTLRGLQPDEWVELAVNFKSAVGKNRYSKSIIKVKKKTIDDFYRDKINFKQFKNLVQIVYY